MPLSPLRHLSLGLALGLAPAALCAQSVFPSVHLGAAEGNSSLHKMAGASLSFEAGGFQEIRFRLDGSIGPSTAHSSNRPNSRLTSLAAEWIFHKRGTRTGGFLIGAGFSQDRFKWNYIDDQGAVLPQSGRRTDMHLVLGGGLGRHLRLESRLHLGLFGDNEGDASSTPPNFLLLLSATYAF